MARIPLMNTQNTNPNVPDLGQGPSVSKAGQAWDAVARVGQVISNVGNDIAMMRKEAEMNSFMTSSKADIDRQVTEKEKELDQKYAGKDPTGYASEMNEFLSEMGSSIMDSAPRDSVRQAFSTRFSEISNNIGMNAQAKEDRNRAYYQSTLLEQSSQKDRQILINNPNSEKASTFYLNTLEGIKGGIGLFWDQPQADKMMKEQAMAYGQSYLEGAMQNKRYGEIVRFADGKDPNGKVLLDNLDPSWVQKYKGEALRKMESEAELSKMVLGKQIQDVTAAVYSGKEIPADTVMALRGKISMLKPEERAYAMDDLEVTLAYGAKLREAKSMKISEIAQARSFMLDHGDDVFNLHGRMGAQKKFEEGLKQIVDQKLNNAPAFYASEDNEFKLMSKQALDISNPAAMKSWADRVSTKQKQDGASFTKVLTPEMSKTYAAMLKSKNPDSVNMVRDALAGGYTNEHFGKVISEMVLNKDLDQDMAMAMYLPDPELRKQYVQNIGNKKQIEEDYSRRPKDVKTGLKELFEDSEVQELKKAILAGDNGNNRLWINNSLDSGLELNYKALVARGESVKDAKEKAMAMVAGNFTAASAGKSNVIVPKQFQGMKSNIEDFMDASLTTPSLNSMNIMVPREYMDSPLMIGKDQSEIKQKYLDDIVKQGRWISNSTQTGAILTKVNPDGSTTPVRDSNGSIVERSFTDMRDTGISFEEEIGRYQAEIDSIKEEAKTNLSAAGRVAIAQMNISRLKTEQRKRGGSVRTAQNVARSF